MTYAHPVPDESLCPDPDWLIHKFRGPGRGIRVPHAWERIWSKIDTSGDCWEWTAARGSDGYGSFRGPQGSSGAHRQLYQLMVGGAEGKDLDHLCRNRTCVNPDHLEPVSHQVNVQRGGATIRRPLIMTCRSGRHDLTTPESRRWIKGRMHGCLACHKEVQRRFQANKRKQAAS